MQAELHRGSNLSEAWLNAATRLNNLPGGVASNFCVAFDVHEETPQIRRVLDDFVAARRAKLRQDGKKENIYAPATVANTLFPASLYRWDKPGEHSRQHLYDMHDKVMSVQSRLPLVDGKDNYFHRLVHWQVADGDPINQLDAIVVRMRHQRGLKSTLSSPYEASIENPELDLGADARIQRPDDRSPIGFPCLSHVSFTMMGDRLDLAALYRNQHFVSRAYGNYLGLSRLLRFVAQETGCTPGEVLCIATHADMEHSLGKARLDDLLAHARTVEELTA